MRQLNKFECQSKPSENSLSEAALIYEAASKASLNEAASMRWPEWKFLKKPQ